MLHQDGKGAAESRIEVNFDPAIIWKWSVVNA